MMFARFVARRYLFSPKSRSVVNLIAGLSVLSVAMPVAAMVILLSVFNGFESLVKSMCAAFDAPLTVTPIRGQTFTPERLDTAALSRIEGVDGLSFILEQVALAGRDGRQAAVTVRGVDEAYSRVMPLAAEAIVSGEYGVRLGDLDRLVIGQTMAYTLGIRSLADADVDLYALRRGSFSPLLPLDSYKKRILPVAGVYALDLDTERQYILTSLRLTRELFSYPDRASALLVGVSVDADPERVKRAVAQVTGDDFRVRTRAQMRASFYTVMNYEKWGIFFISLLVLVIASFSVVGALAMLITDKRRDVATLRSLGASIPLLRSLFRWEGWFVSGLGGVVGLVLGVGLCLVQQHFGVIEIPAETFLMKSYPVELRAADLVVVAVAFAVVTTLITQLTVRAMIKNEKR